MCGILCIVYDVGMSYIQRITRGSDGDDVILVKIYKNYNYF